MNVHSAYSQNLYSYQYTTPTQEVQQNSTQNKEETNKVLGYEVDKNGYFTSKFNKTAGISEDIKISSKSVQEFLKGKTTKDDRFANYDDIDIAKTLGSAYQNLKQKDESITSDKLISQAEKNPSLIQGDVSYMGRLKGLDPKMSPEEFRLQASLVTAEYNNGLTKINEKTPDYIKDIVNFVEDLKEFKNERLRSSVEEIYGALKDDDKATFDSLKDKAKDAITKLNEDRSDAFVGQMFGNQNTKALDDFTSFYMKAQEFFNRSSDEKLNNTQHEIANAFSSLYKQQANLMHLNILA